jgi:hypothetical protein
MEKILGFIGQRLTNVKKVHLGRSLGNQRLIELEVPPYEICL